MIKPHNLKLDPMIDVYTDGSCFPNPGPGGWCAIILYEGEHILSSGERVTTNNRMEMMPVIAALRTIPVGQWDITIWSDSQYVVRGMGEWTKEEGFAYSWLKKWRKNGWRQSNGERLKNADLWIELARVMQLHQSVTAKWIRGHVGNKYNERCDEIAMQERLKWPITK